jgi:hypothetical protein
MKKITIALALFASNSAFAGSTPQQDGYHAATRYDQTKAYCEALADKVNAQSGAGVLRALIDHSHSYDQCMTILGFVR